MERAPSQRRAETVRSFWHGEPLNAYQLLCLRSFAAHGYRVELYSYDPSLAAPDGIERKDASEILPPERVLRYRSGTGPGSFAAHTNLFRHALLHRLGGWWADPDLLLLRGDLPQDEIFFAAFGQLDQVSCNLVKFPRGHPLLADATARAAALDLELWAQAGTPLLTVLIKQYGLAELCRPPTDSSPVAWFELPMLFDPSRVDEVRDRCTAAYALDLHDEVWRGSGIPFRLAPPEGSYLDFALRRHDLGSHFPARIDFADAARWIENLRNSIALDAQLRALQAGHHELEARYRALEGERDALLAASVAPRGRRDDSAGRAASSDRRRTLVITRVGDASLHPGWLTGAPPESRTWDLHLSYFGDRPDPFADRPDDVTLSFDKGTKSAGLEACMTKLADRIASYDWICVIDDDVAADLATWNRFVEIVEEYDLDLAQPALGSGSYVAHDITRQRPHMALRFTTFVELMVACLSQRAFELGRPYLNATVSSWGPDLLLPKLLGYPKDKIAIIDDTPVIHTRPFAKGPNIARARELGVDPKNELQDFLDRHGVTRRFDTWGGITREGRYTADLAEIDRFKAEPASWTVGHEPEQKCSNCE
jgi:uncharacterized protein DUF707